MAPTLIERRRPWTVEGVNDTAPRPESCECHDGEVCLECHLRSWRAERDAELGVAS